MNYRILDFLRLLTNNWNSDIVYLEKTIEKETGKPYQFFLENEKIQLYHKITGSKKDIYTPSVEFLELCNAFIEFEKPSFCLNDWLKIKPIFEKHNIKKSINQS